LKNGPFLPGRGILLQFEFEEAVRGWDVAVANSGGCDVIATKIDVYVYIHRALAFKPEFLTRDVKTGIDLWIIKRKRKWKRECTAPSHRSSAIAATSCW
jgi:hypothetical protein